MTLDEAAANIGKRVVYQPHPGWAEYGVITSVNPRWVFVCYDTDDGPRNERHSKATAAVQLQLVAGSP